MIVKKYHYLVSEITITCKSFIQKKKKKQSHFDDGSIDRFHEIEKKSKYDGIELCYY